MSLAIDRGQGCRPARPPPEGIEALGHCRPDAELGYRDGQILPLFTRLHRMGGLNGIDA
jgi:hypothetical protein